MDDYFNAAGEHYSTLKLLLTASPLAYKHARANQLPDTDTFRKGRAAHTAVLEPHRFERDYATWTGGDRRGAKWNEFRELHADVTILTADQRRTAIAIAEAVRSHPVAGPMLVNGAAEVQMNWHHERTGINCKARLDWLSTRWIADLKTCRDPSPRKFAAAAARLRYPMQMAMYQAAVRATLGYKAPARIIAVQSQAPYDVVVYDVGDDVLDVGERDYEEALDILVACRGSDQWPGVAATPIPLELPDWAMPDWDEDADEWEVRTVARPEGDDAAL